MVTASSPRPILAAADLKRFRIVSKQRDVETPYRTSKARVLPSLTPIFQIGVSFL